MVLIHSGCLIAFASSTVISWVIPGVFKVEIL